MRLEGKTAIVTGSARGLGRSFAMALSEEGANVSVADVEFEQARLTAQWIEKSTRRSVVPLKTDVTSEADCARMAEMTYDAFGRIDVLVNNAAVYYGIKKKPFTELTTEEWDRMMAVNVRGPWLCSKAVYPYMSQQKSGKIINVASAAFFQATPNMLHYVTSKAAVVGLTRALAKELGALGISVNAIAPGIIMTEATKSHTSQQMHDTLIQKRSMRREETAEDLVGSIKFLASSDSDFMTGQTMVVDGGASFV